MPLTNYTLFSNTIVEDYLWIALSQTMYHGKFVWLTTGEDLNYTNWAAGQPNKFQKELCGVATSNDGKWHDADCASIRFFVCEKEDEM